MPVPRRRHSKQRRDKSRTHDKLHPIKLGGCANCGAPKHQHRICPACGYYKGRSYKTIVTK